MRIISGSARGKRLAAISGADIRPTPDRVREAVFNILASRFGSLDGVAVLDLFAGTGAMAIEALSRGAQRAVLIDKGSQAARVIPANLGSCSMREAATFFRDDVAKVLPGLKRAGPFDLVFLDPPYGQGLLLPTLEAIDSLGLLAPHGLACAEAERGEVVPDSIGALIRVDRRTYGSTAIHFFSYPEAPS